MSNLLPACVLDSHEVGLRVHLQKRGLGVPRTHCVTVNYNGSRVLKSIGSVFLRVKLYKTYALAEASVGIANDHNTLHHCELAECIG